MHGSAVFSSPLGPLTLTCSDSALVGLWFPHQKGYPAALPPIQENHPVLVQAKDWLSRYFAGAAPTPRELPLAPQGTPFCRRVWQLLCTIPYGETVTYGALAEQLAAGPNSRPTSARAIGGAVGRNPISIIIPCHRVIGAGGALTGYAGGLERKTYLLKLEK